MEKARADSTEIICVNIRKQSRISKLIHITFTHKFKDFDNIDTKTNEEPAELNNSAEDFQKIGEIF